MFRRSFDQYLAQQSLGEQQFIRINLLSLLPQTNQGLLYLRIELARQ